MQLQLNLLVLIQRIVYDQGFDMILTKVADWLSIIKLPLIKLFMKVADAIFAIRAGNTTNAASHLQKIKYRKIMQNEIIYSS